LLDERSVFGQLLSLLNRFERPFFARGVDITVVIRANDHCSGMGEAGSSWQAYSNARPASSWLKP
jgi:hypothetical protein